MGAGDRPGWTVLVLGKPGETSRRYRITRRAIVFFALAIPCAGLGLGYVLRSRQRAAPAQVTSIAASSDVPSSVAAPRLPAIPTLPPAKTAVAADAGELAAADRAQLPVPAPGAPATEGAPAGEPLRIMREGQDLEPIEVHPFAADGSTRASAFALLETKMACGSGHSQAPDPALVRVLLEAQHNFGKPLVLIAGRCPAHDDHPDTAAHHRAGRAADVRVRGVSSEQLMSWLIERGVGGAGRYKRAGYVHVDVRVGPREQWDAVEPIAEKPTPRPAAASAADQAQAPGTPSPAAAPEPTPPVAPAGQDDVAGTVN